MTLLERRCLRRAWPMTAWINRRLLVDARIGHHGRRRDRPDPGRRDRSGAADPMAPDSMGNVSICDHRRSRGLQARSVRLVSIGLAVSGAIPLILAMLGMLARRRRHRAYGARRRRPRHSPHRWVASPSDRRPTAAGPTVNIGDQSEFGGAHFRWRTRTTYGSMWMAGLRQVWEATPNRGRLCHHGRRMSAPNTA